MNTQNKLLPVALVAALLGGSVGAFVMRPSSKATDATVSSEPVATQKAAPTQNLVPTSNTTEQTTPAQNTEVATNDLNAENESFRQGFTEGVRAAREEGVTNRTTAHNQVVPTASNIVYRNAPARTRVARSTRSGGSRQVYYDYSQPRQRTFWQKHRDKLTVAAGSGGGAILGALIGGRKGAGIGALAGAGGSALYTYKVRNRNRRF